MQKSTGELLEIVRRQIRSLIDLRTNGTLTDEEQAWYDLLLLTESELLPSRHS